MTESNNQRRNFVKKAAYVAPAILTLAAVPSYAKFGSNKLDFSNGNQGNNGTLGSRYHRNNNGGNGNNRNNNNQGNNGDLSSRYHRNNGSNNQGNNGNNNQGSNGNAGGQSEVHAQSQFRANPYADYRARHGFIDYSGARGPDAD